jgi:hypothetical protein
LTATLTATIALLGGTIDDGVTETLLIVGGVVSAAGGITMNARVAPFSVPVPTTTPAALTAFACCSTQPESAGMRVLRSKDPSFAVCANARGPFRLKNPMVVPLTVATAELEVPPNASIFVSPPANRNARF